MSTTNIQLSIEKIEIKSFSMTNEVIRFTAKDSYSVEFSFAVSLPDENGRMNFNLDMVVDREENGFMGRLASIKTISTFLVKEHNRYLSNDSNGVSQIDGPLVKVLMDLCMHQLRGAWAAKTEGTPIESIVVPLINTDTLLGQVKQPAS